MQNHSISVSHFPCVASFPTSVGQALWKAAVVAATAPKIHKVRGCQSFSMGKGENTFHCCEENPNMQIISDDVCIIL